MGPEHWYSPQWGHCRAPHLTWLSHPLYWETMTTGATTCKTPGAPPLPSLSVLLRRNPTGLCRKNRRTSKCRVECKPEYTGRTHQGTIFPTVTAISHQALTVCQRFCKGYSITTPCNVPISSVQRRKLKS